MYKRFKCFNVNFRLLKTIYVHLLVCYLNIFETYYSCYELTQLVAREDFIITFDQSWPVENNQIQQEETDCQNV